MFREAQERTIATPQATAGFLSRAAVQLRQVICGLHGHDALLHFGKGRISLQCASCGYETPGWDVKADPSRTIMEKPRMVRMRLVRQRPAA